MSRSLVAPTRDRPTTIGETGRRQWLYPARASGRWTRRRNLVDALLIGLFLALPWLEVGGEQAVLLDLPRRKLALFGLVLWPQDSYLLWLVLFIAILTVFFVTAQWGRLWCGWACPQTVFLEGVFRRIEAWIEGGPHARMRLDAAAWSWAKLARKSLKHILFLALAAVVGNTFLCYFAASERVVAMALSSPAQSPGWFAVMSAVALVFYLDFAWFREQLCVIACPYGRWQSVLLDAHSGIVAYDHARGEARGTNGARRKADAVTYGDCVDCGRCVAVCPTGIDIRDGLQMECVNCTACIDACDDVMAKTSRPLGLIRHTSLEELAGRPRVALRPRTIAYGTALLVAVAVLAFAASRRKLVEVQVVRASGAGVATVVGDTLTNHFRAKLVNKRDEAIAITLRPQPGYVFKVPLEPWPVPAGSTATMEVFVLRPLRDFQPGGLDRPLFVFEVDGEEVGRQRAPLLGPGRSGHGGK